MRVLVIGAYGLIGGYVTARLLSDGHEVVAAGRDVTAAARRTPKAHWVRADLGRLDGDGWTPLLAGVDAVVNCAGALQDSPRDDLSSVHVSGLTHLADACVAAGVRRFVQISAAGVEQGEGAFRRTKREGEAALRARDLDWVILRPGLVLASAAYGGSGLLRGLAAFPGLIPLTHAAATVQVVSVEDVAEGVARALAPDGPRKVCVDLAAPETTTLAQVLTALRAWLGLPPAPTTPLPPGFARLAALAADGLAWLGWRSPMRSTALAELVAGVKAEAGDGPRLLGFAPRGLDAILAGWPAGVQERWYGRLYFVKPLALATLAAFWSLSGAIGLARAGTAARVLTEAGVDGRLAHGFVLVGGVADLALGLLVCVRRTAPWALKGMVAVTLAYLLGATLWRPDLWGDPLGPLVKTIPAAVLALAALAMMDER